MTDLKDTVIDLAGEANIDKPFVLSGYIFFRALGKQDKEAAEVLGVHPRTLSRYSKKLEKFLDMEDRQELVAKSVQYEYGERQ